MRKTSFVLVACAACFSLAPAVAQAGFFESLFGLSPAPAPAPAAAAPSASASPYLSRSRSRYRTGYEPREHRRREHRAIEARDDGHRRAKREHAASDQPKLQQTTDLMDDRTLRAGDAVMTKEGLRVFAGVQADHHADADFVPLHAARRGRKGRRLALVAIDDAAHLDIGRDRRAGLETGRSVSVATERRPSFADAKVMVRYVGP